MGSHARNWRGSWWLIVEGGHKNETPRRNNVNRGTFSVLFLLQCMEALGVNDVRFQLREMPCQGADSGRPVGLQASSKAV